jgi:hypothetical protein
MWSKIESACWSRSDDAILRGDESTTITFQDCYLRATAITFAVIKSRSSCNILWIDATAPSRVDVVDVAVEVEQEGGGDGKVLRSNFQN